ncbi:MAG: PD-(D/E)XK nuclease family protein [Bacteroidales bacterium]|nr:PD-(D/E)XK nuclease family protein [Bacteroidales bacterium]
MESAEEILDLIDVINSEMEKCCSEILQLTEDFAQKYRELLPQLPYNINVIDELHINENGHSRILTKLLQFKNQDGKYEILESFLKYIVNEMHREEFANINIKKPIITQEKCRIDLWVRDSGYAIIFENKACDATDQEAQIHRYIERTIQENYKEEQIYVVYLPSYEKEPTDQSWGSYKEQFKDRYANISFRNGILYWLKNDVQPNVRQKDSLLLSAITQYIDYLEGIFSLRTINNKINMDLQGLISEQILKDAKTPKEKIMILKNKLDDISNLQNQINQMKDKYATEWLVDISKKYQANMSKDGNNDCVEKEIGAYTLILCARKQGKPWWGIQKTSDITESQKKTIIDKINNLPNIDSRNLDTNNPYYLVLSDTSYENGESRFEKLIEILSE